jgi:hypothetical protein
MTQMTKEEKDEYVKSLIENRKVTLTFEPPRFSLVTGVYTVLSHYDLICIYRQIKNHNIKNQIKRFIDEVDIQQGIISDIDKIVLPRKYKEEEHKRCVVNYSVKKTINGE